MFSNPKVQGQKEKDKLENLKKYARDLTSLAQDGKLDPVIGRTNETTRVIQVLSRKRKNNPILTGPPGTGKTAIVEALASRIQRRDVPITLQQCRVFELSMTALIAGASYKGEYEQRLKSVIDEVSDSHGKIILFVDEAHQLISANGDAMDAANILKPALARGDLKMVAATTETEYKLHFEKDPALVRRFAKIDVSEPTVEETVSILRGIKDKYEEFHGVKIKDSALVAAAQLADRYITGKYNPDKAIDLVDIACAGVRVQLDSSPAIIDELERKVMQLNVEKIALEQELSRSKTTRSPPNTAEMNDATGDVKDDDDMFSLEQTQQRLKYINEQILAAEGELNPLKRMHEQARGSVDQLQAAKKKLSETQSKLANAEVNRDLYLISDLKNHALPELQQRIKSLEKKVQEEKLGAKDLTNAPLISEIVDAHQIANVVSQLTGVPVKKLSQTERKRLLSLEDELKAKVVGQAEAVRAVSDSILRSRAGFSQKGQPIASFLLCGPTGTGKTELAKALASLLFDSERSLVRFDMSEYSESHSVSKLIGAPQGYVGYDNGGSLTEAVRQNPYSLVLFDEVEKAAKNVFDTLLQVLDDGRLTDNHNRVVDFSNTIIIFTSNLGSQQLLQNIDVKTGTFKTTFKATKDKVLTEVKKFFKPEFLNRISELIVFTPLTHKDMTEIIHLQVQQLNKRMRDKHILLTIDENTIRDVIMRAYDPLFGARPIKRFIEHVVVTNLSRAIISGKLASYSKVTIGTNTTLLNEVKAREAAESVKAAAGVGFSDEEDISPKLLEFTFTPLTREEKDRLNSNSLFTTVSRPASPGHVSSGSMSDHDEHDDEEDEMHDF